MEPTGGEEIDLNESFNERIANALDSGDQQMEEATASTHGNDVGNDVEMGGE